MSRLSSARRHVPAMILVVVSLSVVGSVSARDFPWRNRKDQKPSQPQGQVTNSGVVTTDFTKDTPPDDRVTIHLDLARSHELQNNPQAAIVEYLKAVEAADQPGRRFSRDKPAPAIKALAHRRMAAAYDRMGRFAQAEVHYREALRLAPKDARVWNDAGYSSYLQHKWSEAEQRLRTAARIAPEDPRIQTNLGLCLAASGRTPEALAALSRAGGPAVGHANLAYLLAATGRREEARVYYRKALDLQPALTPAREALARLDTIAPAATAPDSALASTARPTASPTVARASTPAPTSAAQPRVASDPRVARTGASSAASRGSSPPQRISALPSSPRR